MAKQNSPKQTEIRKTNFNLNKDINLQLPKLLENNWLYILLIFVLTFIFFGAGIFGNGFNASDTIASESFRKYLEQASKNGEFPLWIPYIFSGMPAFSGFVAHGERIWDFLSLIYFKFMEFFRYLFGNDEARVAMHYVVYGIGVYLLMLQKKANKLVAGFTSIAAVFSTGIVIWLMIGHNTKPVVFAMYPWIFLFMEKLKEKFSLIYIALIVIAAHIMLEATHVQMIFYAGIAFGLYLLYNLIGAAVKKQTWKSFLTPAVALVAGFGIAFLLSADKYLSVQDYTPYSTRGSAPLLQEGQQEKVTKDGGHDYNYATQWSFSPGETFTFLVPNYYGFGKMKYNGPETGGREMTIPTYWGQKPFEDAAPYAGIIVLVLGIVGIVLNRKDLFVQFLTVLSVFAVILSFGYTMPVLYDFFYYNVPFFNKFRAPSMVLALVHFALPILAGYGLSSIITLAKENPEKAKKFVIKLVYGSVGFLVLGFIFAGLFKDSYISSIASSASFRLPEQFREFVFDNMISDWYINAFLLIIAMLVVYTFVLRKVSFVPMMLGLIVIVLFDLWRVGWRPMEVAEQKLTNAYFQSDDAIEFVKQDKSVFRVADFASPSPNIAAYHLLQNVNGYHAAKLRVYQDMLDATAQGSTNNVTSPFMWNLLNVKYILAKEDLGIPPVYQSQTSGTKVYLNSGMLPRAFFVDSAVKSNPKEILMHLKNSDFDPRKVAFYHNESNIQISPADTNSIAEIQQYKNEHITFKVRSAANQLLVVSEVYYPEWKAYLDGKEIPIYQINYLLRGVVIPTGEHKLEMKYESKSFETGRTLSLSFNIIVTIMLAMGLYLEFKKRKQV